MTETQEAVYNFLVAFFEKNQRFPSYREVAKGLKYKSIAGVQCALIHLRKNGFVDWEDRKPRTLRLTGYRVKLEKIEPA